MAHPAAGFDAHPENIYKEKHTPATIKKMKAAHRAKYPPFFRIRSAPISNKTLRKRYLELGVLEACTECQMLPRWRGKPLTLHLDHINGNKADNHFKNLRFLCPNCHTQTPTYGWRNIKFQKEAKIQ